jgi:parvulin-like peptidyl-prolyl isomerase
MRTAIAFIALTLISLAACAQSATLDRTVARVNREVIMLSDWRTQAQFEALMAAQGAVTSDSDAVLDRMIDQTLISQQMKASGFAAPSDTEVAAEVMRIRAELGFSPDAEWAKALASHSLDENDIRRLVGLQLQTMRFIDVRFRQSVLVTPDQVETYYREQFLPMWKQSKATAAPALRQVSAQVEQILTEQRLADLMQKWIEVLRSEARIEKISGAAATQEASH